MRSARCRSPFMPVTELTTSRHPAGDQPPLVSILIAARNEEADILRCLQAVAQLDYPIGAVEVLIGNDQSTDRTGAIITEFITDRPHFRRIDMTEPVAGLRGKANVLAQLARQARGHYLFFTDADTRVPTTWLQAMLRDFTLVSPTVGIVTGVTLPEGPKPFHKLQTIDWLYNLTLTHLLSRAGVPVTAMGNNLAVSRAAYDAVGGYEALPFSVTEDYTLFRAITGRGFGFRNLLDRRVLARTRPVDTLRALLHQRKRWMRGAMGLPGWIVVLLYVRYLLGPLLFGLGVFAPAFALGLYLAHLGEQTLVIGNGLARLRQTKLWPYALLFEIYQLIIGPLAVVFYWLPTPMEWKGRRYT